MAPILAALGVLSACVDAPSPALNMAPAPPSAAASPPAAAAPAGSVMSVQPQLATYRCGEKGSITIQNLGASVVLTDQQGESITLPASPQMQRARYGQKGYALVLDGRDALYMRGGKEPLNCSR